MTRDLPAPTFSDDPILNIEINKALSHINHLMTRPCDVRTAVSRIESHNASSPLFLYVAFQAPHGPIMTPPRTYLDMYSSPQYNTVRRRGALNRHATVSVRGGAI